MDGSGRVFRIWSFIPGPGLSQSLFRFCQIGLEGRIGRVKFDGFAVGCNGILVRTGIVINIPGLVPDFADSSGWFDRLFHMS